MNVDFQDVIHLERIASALWSRRNRGRAAVMIGSGMSVNARHKDGIPGHGGFPTWASLSEAFVNGLYPSSGDAARRQNALDRSASTSGSLRLAEEYEAAHGRTALDQLLLSTIPDKDFDPGPLHHLLLNLPWSDVFTTNYDTLLERAARTVAHRRYDVVTAAPELGHARRPRIVKLHGSFPSSRPFTITEEDFRTYPVRAAAFVNLARQAFVENSFCLLGFSGDDPNFLQWSGWARDTLGSSVSQIYLCGVLDLTAAQRKLLQDRHVMPIDLAPIFPVDTWTDPKRRHAAATEWVLLSLESARPPDVFDWPFRSPSPKTPPSINGLPQPLDLCSDRDFEREAVSPQFVTEAR